MKKIDVYYEGWGEFWKLGRLADNGQHLLFEYTSEALTQGLELSPLNLKLTNQTYGDFPFHQMRLPGLIADSLPDGWGLLLMDKLFRKQGLKIEDISPIDRLAFLGDRAMGALSFKPSSELEVKQTEFTMLEIGQEVQKIIKDRASQALADLAIIGGSPHGARPKVLAFYQKKTNTVSLQPMASASHWLFKFPAQGEHIEVCAIEALYAKLAKKAGLEINDTKYFEIGKNLAAFGTERFDRKGKFRIPVHTLAGILNADFRRPSSVDYLTLMKLTRFITKDEREVCKAYRQCVFNIVFNNRDDHSKNFSFRMDDLRNWKLSPSYDLTFNIGPGGEHQMDLFGEGRSLDINHLKMLAEKSGIPLPEALRIIDSVLVIAQQFKLEAQHWPIRRSTITKVEQAIKTNCSRLKC